MPRVDRAGGREGKKSLRKNKQKKYSEEKSQLKPQHTREDRPPVSVPPPPVRFYEEPFEPACAAHPPLPLVDGSCALLSRQFDRDLNAVLARATRAGVVALVASSTDYAKQADLCALARQNAGLVYAMVGISPDVIKRTNDKLFMTRLAELRDMALGAEVVAVCAGLDLAREIGTHGLQQQLLEAQLSIAHQLRLPLCLRIKDSASIARSVEMIAAHKLATNQPANIVTTTPIPPTNTSSNIAASGDSSVAPVVASAASSSASSSAAPLPSSDEKSASAEFTDRIAIYGFSGSEEDLRALIQQDCYIMFTGHPLCDKSSAEGTELQRLLTLVPRERIILMTDSPVCTPQNIEDEHMRTTRNEPSNLAFVYGAAAEALGIPFEALYLQVTANAMRFFGLRQQTKEDLMNPPEVKVDAISVDVAAARLDSKPARILPQQADKVDKLAADTSKKRAKGKRADSTRSDDADNDDSHATPTKLASKEDSNEDEDEEDLPINLTKKQRQKLAKQRQLAGAGALQAGSEQEDSEEDVQQPIHSKKRTQNAKARPVNDDDDDEDDAFQSQGGKNKRTTPSKPPKSKPAARKRGSEEEEEEEEDQEESAPSRNVKRQNKGDKSGAKTIANKPKAARRGADDDDQEEEENDDAADSRPSSSKTNAKPKTKPDDDTTSKKKSDSRKDVSKPTPKHQSTEKKKPPKNQEEEEEEEEEVAPKPAAAAAKTKRASSGKTKGPKPVSDEEEEDDDDDEPPVKNKRAPPSKAKGLKPASDDEEDEESPAKKKRAPPGKAKGPKPKSDEDDEEEPPAKNKRALPAKSKGQKKPLSEEEEEDAPKPPAAPAKTKRASTAKEVEEEEDDRPGPGGARKGHSSDKAKAKAKDENKDEKKKKEERGNSKGGANRPISADSNAAARSKREPKAKSKRKDKQEPKATEKPGKSTKPQRRNNKDDDEQQEDEKEDEQQDEEDDEEDEEDDDSSKQKKGKAPKKGGGDTDSKVGSDEPRNSAGGALSTDAAAKYACRKCRQILFTGDDIIPHNPPSTGKGAGNEKKSASCEMAFITPQEWMAQPQNHDDEDEELAAELARLRVSKTVDVHSSEFLKQARMNCPKCSQKLGTISSSVMRCSCGAAAELPAFAVLRSRIDCLRPVDVHGLSAGVITVSDPDLLTAEERAEAFEREREERTEQQRRRDLKKTKKQSLEAATKGNFSSFRNKQY